MEVFKCPSCNTWFEEQDVIIEDDNYYCVKCNEDITEIPVIDALEQLNN